MHCVGEPIVMIAMIGRYFGVHA